MMAMQELLDQIKSSGSDFRFWGRGEIKELSKVLAPDERIHKCVNGHYVGGFAMLTASDRRLILVDRKPMYLTLEAIWYDKIGQVDYNHRLLNATICISTPNKDLTFTSWNSIHLRDILIYTQEKMIAAKAGETLLEQRMSQAISGIENQEPAAVLSSDSQYNRYGDDRDSPERLTPQDYPSLQQASPIYKSDHNRFIKFPLELTTRSNLYPGNRLPFTRRRRFSGADSRTTY